MDEHEGDGATPPDEGGDDASTPEGSAEHADNPAPPIPPVGPVKVGTWRFETALGGIRCGASAPCPICGGVGGGTWCEISAADKGHGHRAVRCRGADGLAFKPGTRRPSRDGSAEYVAGNKVSGGRVWAPIDDQGEAITPTPRTPEELKADAAWAAAADECKRSMAEQELRLVLDSDAAVDHPWVRAYLKGRGIDPAWFPDGKVPRALRFSAEFPLWYDFDRRPKGCKHPLERMVHAPKGGKPAEMEKREVGEIRIVASRPAMVAGVFGYHDLPRFVRGVHATYLRQLADGSVAKDVDAVGGGRREHASCDGLVLIVGEGASKDLVFPTGVALVGEGFETTLSAYVACGCRHTAIVAAHTTGLGKLAGGGGMLATAPWAWQIHTLVGLVDLDKLRKKDGGMGRAGQRIWDDVAEGLASAQRWITLHRAFMRSEDYPSLVRSVELVGKDAADAERGRLGCAVRREDGVWIEEQPADPAKGVDWNDALVSIVSERPGFRLEVGATIMRGCDVDANAARSDAVRSGSAASVGSSNEGDDRDSDDSPAPPENADARTRGGPAEQKPSSGARGGGSGRGGSGGGDDAAAAADGEDDQRIVPSTDLGRAMMFLWQTMAAAERKRVGTCYKLKHVGGEFKRWDRNVWRPMRAKGEIVAIRGLVRQWLTGKGEWAKDKEGDRYFKPLNPALKTVEAVAKCVLDEVRVETEELRFWMPPDFDPLGEPVKGRKPWQRWVEKPERSGLPAPKDLIALENCVLDARAMEQGKLETRTHDPRLFNEHVLPFGIPIAKVKAALADGVAGIDELANELCPDVLDYMSAAFGCDDNPVEAAEQMAVVRKLIWYYCTYSMDCKEANIAIILGPDNAGKGTLMDLIKAIVGAGNFVSSTVDEAADKNHITSWVGKRVAFVSEAESGERADLRRCMNFWKRVSGGDGVSVRELYQLERPDVVLPTRICVSANEMPDMKDRTGALLSRMICLVMRESHTGKASYDRGLKARVLAQAPGAFVWALGGALEMGRLKAKGERVFTQPAAGAGSMLGYGDFQSDVPAFISDWLQITGNASDGLLSRDMWEAYVCYRKLNDDKHPERGGPSVLTKAIETLLWKAGWKGKLDAPLAFDARTGQKRRLSRYTKLKLSPLALASIAEVEARRVVSNDDDRIPFDPPPPRD